MTSTFSKAMRDIEVLRSWKLSPRVWTPTISNAGAMAGDAGVLAGRAAPALAAAAMLADIARSRNRARTLAADAGATLGGGAGGLLLRSSDRRVSSAAGWQAVISGNPSPRICTTASRTRRPEIHSTTPISVIDTGPETRRARIGGSPWLA